MKEQTYLLDLEYHGIYFYHNLKEILKDDHLTNVVYNEIMMVIITIINDKGYNESSLDYIKNITFQEAYGTLLKVKEFTDALYYIKTNNNGEQLLLNFFKEIYIHIFFSLYNKQIINNFRDSSLITLLHSNTRFLLITNWV